MTKLKLLFIQVLLLTAHSVWAVNDTQIAACAKETDSTKRLACYDQLAETISSGNGVEQKGGWSFETIEDRYSGIPTLALWLESKSPVKIEEETVRPVLGVTCKVGRVSVLLNWQFTLGRDSIRMRTYFDNMPHRSAVWSISDDFKTVTPRRGDIQVVKRMIQHSNLAVEITPFGGRPANAEFDITGLDEALNPLRESCSI